jgi:hypothetical protein
MYLYRTVQYSYSGLLRHPEAAVPGEASPRQRRLPAVHRGQGAPPHERHLLGHPHLLRQAPGPHRQVRYRRDREGMVRHLGGEGHGADGV